MLADASLSPGDRHDARPHVEVLRDDHGSTKRAVQDKLRRHGPGVLDVDRHVVEGGLPRGVVAVPEVALHELREDNVAVLPGHLGDVLLESLHDPFPLSLGRGVGGDDAEVAEVLVEGHGSTTQVLADRVVGDRQGQIRILMGTLDKMLVPNLDAVDRHIHRELGLENLEVAGPILGRVVPVGVSIPTT